MITLKEAAKTVKEKAPNASFFGAFEYNDLYIFHVYNGDVWIKGSSMDYYVSVNKNTGAFEYFNDWKEAFANPDEYIPASQKVIDPKDFT